MCSRFNLTNAIAASMAVDQGIARETVADDNLYFPCPIYVTRGKVLRLCEGLPPGCVKEVGQR